MNVNRGRAEEQNRGRWPPIQTRMLLVSYQEQEGSTDLFLRRRRQKAAGPDVMSSRALSRPGPTLTGALCGTRPVAVLVEARQPALAVVQVKALINQNRLTPTNGRNQPASTPSPRASNVLNIR